MNKSRVKFSLYLSYFVFSILLNSVYIVIPQSIFEYGVDNDSATVLSVMQDMAFVGIAFIFAPFVPRIGYKRSMQVALACSVLVCLPMPLRLTEDMFWAPKVLFLLTGVGFAFVRISAYSMLGILADDPKHHAQMMNFMEAFFALGFVFTLAMFGFFAQSESIPWLYGFWVIAAVAVLAFIVLHFTSFEEPKVVRKQARFNVPASLKELLEMMSMLTYTLVFMFVLSLLFLMFTEVQFLAWFPSFRVHVLNISEMTTTIKLGLGILLALFVGRIIGGVLITKVGTLYMLIVSLIGAMGMLILITRQTENFMYPPEETWETLPPMIYLILLMAFFWGPVLPTLYATVLSHIEKSKQSSMAGLIFVVVMLCTAMGGYISEYIFNMFSYSVAFFFSIVSITLAMVFIFLFINDLKSSR